MPVFIGVDGGPIRVGMLGAYVMVGGFAGLDARGDEDVVERIDALRWREGAATVSEGREVEGCDDGVFAR